MHLSADPNLVTNKYPPGPCPVLYYIPPSTPSISTPSVLLTKSAYTHYTSTKAYMSIVARFATNTSMCFTGYIASTHPTEVPSPQLSSPPPPVPGNKISLLPVSTSYSPHMKAPVPPTELKNGTPFLSPRSWPTSVLTTEPLYPPSMIPLIDLQDFPSDHPIRTLTPDPDNKP